MLFFHALILSMGSIAVIMYKKWKMAWWWGVGSGKICTICEERARVNQAWSMYLLHIHLLPYIVEASPWASWALLAETMNWEVYCKLSSGIYVSKCSVLFLLLGEQLVHAPSTKESSAMFPIRGDVPQDGRCKDHFGFVNFHLYCSFSTFCMFGLFLTYSLCSQLCCILCICFLYKKVHTHTHTMLKTDIHSELHMCTSHFNNHAHHIESTVSRVGRKEVGVAVHNH
jgi:hypothetical protein